MGVRSVMEFSLRRVAALGSLSLLVAPLGSATAQQFNSDNYLSKPAGIATLIATLGQRNDILMSTFALLPGWEFTTAVYVVNKDDDPNTDDGYSTTFYAKWMLHENAAKTGGLAVKLGTGLDPGYLTEVGIKDAFRSYWMNVPVTFPFRNNTISWDVMPGLSFTRDYGVDEKPAWAFTYSTRVAWYPRSPKLALVGEIFGAEGQLHSIPEYKTGLRFEPNQYETYALTYGQEIGGNLGARLELGMMLFTPPFFCIAGCHEKQPVSSSDHQDR